MITIVLVILLHISIVNRFEKSLYQLYGGWSPRPNCADLQNTFRCAGMPSGHAEASVFLAWLLASLGLSIPVLFVAVFLVCAQRIVSRMHTAWQVASGLAIGMAYTAIYMYLKRPSYILLAALTACAIMVVLSTVRVDKMVKARPPYWLDNKLYPILKKKQNVSFFLKLQDVFIYPFVTDGVLFCSWKQLEIDIEEIARKAPSFDIIVGIKSGGAIMANYMSVLTKKPCCYIKASEVCEKNMVQTFNIAFKKTFSMKENMVVCEGADCNVRGKKVLLLDETVMSGNTFVFVKRFLLEKGATAVTTAAIKDVYKNGVADISLGRHYSVFPWGFDN